MDIAQLGIQVDSRGAVAASKALDNLADTAARAEVATTKLSGASTRMGGASLLAGNGARMMAQQLSQVAQQTSATGNFVQALAIQLPDMALGFGTVGIAAGIVASVALPALANAFGGVSGKASQAAMDMERVKKAQEDLAASSANVQTTIDKLRFGVDEDYQVALLREQLKLRSEYTAKTTELNTYLATTTDSLDRQRISTQGLTEEVSAIAEKYNLNARLLEEQQGRAATLSVIEGVRAQRAGEVAAQQRLAAEAASRQLSAIVDAYSVYAKTRKESESLAEAAGRAGVSAQQLAGIQFGNISGAASEALRLAGNLGIALDTASKLAALGPQGVGGNDPSGNTYSGRGGAPSQGDIVGIRTAGAFGYTTPSFGAGGGGGGGGTDDYAARLEAVVGELETERQIVDEWYAEGQKILADRRAMEILGEEGHKAALLDIEKSYAQQIAAIQSETMQSRLSQSADFFGVLASIAETGGKKLAKAAAVAGAIEGTINTYRGALAALAQPGLSLWGRLAAYGSVLAAGLKGVASIRAAGGIGGGGGSVAPAAQAVQASQNSPTLTLRGLRADDILSGQMLYDIVKSEESLRGLVNVELLT